MAAGAARVLEVSEDVQREDHTVYLRASWRDYLRLDKSRGDGRRPRLTYSDGVLELMSPSGDHDRIGFTIGRLVVAYCEAHELDYTGVGSWTLKSARKRKGLEPDESFIFGPYRGRREPDLAIEVVLSSGAVDKLPLYHALGVREVWIWRRGAITVHVRQARGYRASKRSAVLAGVDLEHLCACIDAPSTSAAVRRFVGKHK